MTALVGGGGGMRPGGEVLTMLTALWEAYRYWGICIGEEGEGRLDGMLIMPAFGSGSPS